MSAALRVLCLAGPTGAGKTAAALELAATFEGEVINADSRQVYRDFPLITAQPSLEEQSCCPHHLYGFLETEQKLSAGRWADRALDVAREVASRGKVPILVGGTGLYFRALLHGIAEIPAVDTAITRHFTERVQQEGPEALHVLLAEVDPEYAARIHPRDRQRIVRALEVHKATGKPFSWWHTHAMPTPRCEGLYLGLDLPLDELTPRLAVRIEAMLKAGALDEARKASAHCDEARAPGWSGIGCAELWQHLAGKLSKEQAADLWLRNTRSYAKRQLTWFRAEPALHRFAPKETQSLCEAARLFLSRCDISPQKS